MIGSNPGNVKPVGVDFAEFRDNYSLRHRVQEFPADQRLFAQSPRVGRPPPSLGCTAPSSLPATQG